MFKIIKEVVLTLVGGTVLFIVVGALALLINIIGIRVQ